MSATAGLTILGNFCAFAPLRKMTTIPFSLLTSSPFSSCGSLENKSQHGQILLNMLQQRKQRPEPSIIQHYSPPSTFTGASLRSKGRFLPLPIAPKNGSKLSISRVPKCEIERSSAISVCERLWQWHNPFHSKCRPCHGESLFVGRLCVEERTFCSLISSVNSPTSEKHTVPYFVRPLRSNSFSATFSLVTVSERRNQPPFELIADPNPKYSILPTGSCASSIKHIASSKFSTRKRTFNFRVVGESQAASHIMSDSHGPPPEGLECLATMEDITLEDGNYGTLDGVASLG